METKPTRMCELLVGLGDVNVLGVDDNRGRPLRVHVETLRVDQGWCRMCGGRASVKDRPPVEFVDLPCFGGPVAVKALRGEAFTSGTCPRRALRGVCQRLLTEAACNKASGP